MKLPFWGTILTIIGVLILCSLGMWQYQRLQWKTDILRDIEREYALDALQIPLSMNDFVSDMRFKRGFLVGAFLHDKEIRIQARTYDGVPGYHILTPLRVEGFDRAVLVNRGWVPIEEEMSQEAVIERSKRVVKLVGMVRYIEQANMFVPDNQPDREVWYQVKTDEIGAAKNLEIMPDVLFYAEGREQGYPFSVATKIRLNNNHAQYMMFWFAMAFVLIVIYMVRFFGAASKT